MSEGPQIRRVRHETKFRRLTVQQVESLTPTMRRITVGGEDLIGFASLGFDDHVKLVFPEPDGALRHPSEETKPVMRDYTPRRFEREEGRLVLDFFIHESGPATQWAISARPGQSLGVGGPRGSFIIPTDMDWHLLIGDESALPAIGRRLEELPTGTRAPSVNISSKNEALTGAGSRPRDTGSAEKSPRTTRLRIETAVGACAATAAATLRPLPRARRCSRPLRQDQPCAWAPRPTRFDRSGSCAATHLCLN